MQFVAHARFIRISPYKLRPLAAVVRGKSAEYALAWLSTYASRRTMPLQKVIASAVANAFSKESVGRADLRVADIRVDQGPIVRYFKPGAQGRTNPQRKRFSHISVKLESRNNRGK